MKVPKEFGDCCNLKLPPLDKWKVIFTPSEKVPFASKTPDAPLAKLRDALLLNAVAPVTVVPNVEGL